MVFRDYLPLIILGLCGIAFVALIAYFFTPYRRRSLEAEKALQARPLELKYADEIAAGEAVIIKANHKSNFHTWMFVFSLCLFLYSFYDKSMFSSCGQVWGVSWAILSPLVFQIIVICLFPVWCTLFKDCRSAFTDGYNPARTNKFTRDTVCFKLDESKAFDLKLRLVVWIFIFLFAFFMPIASFLCGQYGLRNNFESLSDMNRKVQAVCVAHHQFSK